MENIIKSFYHNYFTDNPKFMSSVLNGPSKNLGWSFMAKKDGDILYEHKSVRTYSTFMHLSEEHTYWTPNLFYRRGKRKRNSLRWLNAFFIDIDDSKLSALDVLDKCTEAGLPKPSYINKSPNGLHVYFLLEPVRATPKALVLYEVLFYEIAYALNGDLNAVGAERYIRIPKNVIYMSDERNSLGFFKDWRDLNCDTENIEHNKALFFITKGILNHPAFRVLLQGVEEGKRDNTCFTLALALKVEGYSQEQAFNFLFKWNKKNSPTLPLRVVFAKVKSAFSGGFHGPSSYWVSTLSGINFYYKTIRENKSSGLIRGKYTKFEDVKKKIMGLLKDSFGQVEISQAALAKKLDLPLRSVKKALKCLIEDSLISKTTEGKGRGSKTVYTLNEKVVSLRSSKAKRKTKVFVEQLHMGEMVQNAIHSMDRVVGGTPLQLFLFFNERGSPG